MHLFTPGLKNVTIQKHTVYICLLFFHQKGGTCGLYISTQINNTNTSQLRLTTQTSLLHI